MEPKVTVLLCTLGRRDVLPIALQSYRQQTHKNRELVIVHTGSVNISDLMVDVDPLTYIWCDGNKNLAAKRNIGIRLATGEFIANFDDDDWSGPGRLTQQVQAFARRPELQVVGYSTSFWWDRVDHVASHYRGSPWGASIMYRRSFAIENPWPEMTSKAEDSEFIARASRGDLLLGLEGNDNMVCLMHKGNARREYDPAFWPKVPIAQLPRLFREYEGLSARG